MSEKFSDNKRLFNNTMYLYFRMLLLLIITLYTSRIVLQALGVENYGIFNVIAGLVSMLSFLNHSMSNAVQRYLSFEIGKGVNGDVCKIFNTALVVHFSLAVIIAIALELLGIMYVENIMIIPPDRIVAARWILQCTILMTFITIIQVPFSAAIIARENMSFYAYLSIAEVLLKLFIAYALYLTLLDKLIVYGIMMSCVSFIMLFTYVLYCKKHYNEIRLKVSTCLGDIKQLISFASWNIFGEVSLIISNQGINLLLNSFGGIIVNASRGIADQINGAVLRFVSGFQTAMNPQIIKCYAAGLQNEVKETLFRGIRFSYFVLFILSVPLILEMDIVLKLWLKEVPPQATIFCQLILIASLSSCISNVVSIIARANGNIKKYQLVVSFFLLLNFPLSYLFLFLGFSEVVVFYINIAIHVVLIFVRIRLIKGMLEFQYLEFAHKVIGPIIIVSFFSILLPAIVTLTLNSSLIRMMLTIVISVLSTIVSIYCFGITKTERKMLLNYITKRFS